MKTGRIVSLVWAWTGSTYHEGLGAVGSRIDSSSYTVDPVGANSHAQHAHTQAVHSTHAALGLPPAKAPPTFDPHEEHQQGLLCDTG